MRRRTFLRLGGVVAATGLSGCTVGGGGTTVEMTDDFRFRPETLRVNRGATVAWVNAGNVAHTVTADESGLPEGVAYFASGGFDSERAARNDLEGGLIGADGRYEHTFEATGRFPYFCIPHEGSGMRGEIVVK